MLEQLEGVILMVNTRGIVEDTDIDVLHLIVTHKEENWSVDKLVRVWANSFNIFGDRAKGSVDLVDESVVINSTSANDDDFIISVVSSVVVFD